MSKLVTEKESIIWASGHYLTDHLPNQYDDWEEERLDEYLVYNAWQPFENGCPNFIWECITGLAYDFRKTVNDKLKGKANE